MIGKFIPRVERQAIDRALQEVWRGPNSQPRALPQPSVVLTARQREVLDRVLQGHNNKAIAYDLGISQRTVEHHRAAAMKRTGAKSVPELARCLLG